MKEFECTKCHSQDVFIDKSGNNTGLYCSDCGKWITWLNKDQLRLAERQISQKVNTSDNSSCNICDAIKSGVNMKWEIPQFDIEKLYFCPKCGRKM